MIEPSADRRRASAAVADAPARSTPAAPPASPFPSSSRRHVHVRLPRPGDSVRLVHFGVGLPADLGFEPVGDTELVDADARPCPTARASSTSSRSPTASGPTSSRIRSTRTTARHPFGANSVCEAAGYVEPDMGASATRRAGGARSATSCSTARRSVGRAGTTRLPARRASTTAPATPATRCSSSTTAATTSTTPRSPTVLDNLIHRRPPPAARGRASATRRAAGRVRRRSPPRTATSPTSWCPHLEARAAAGGRRRRRGA